VHAVNLEESETVGGRPAGEADEQRSIDFFKFLLKDFWDAPKTYLRYGRWNSRGAAKTIQSPSKAEGTHNMENKNQDKGFTLVELLIVIVILGILATVTVFAVRGITDKGQENSCAVEKRAIETALEAFFVDTGSDAGSLAALNGDYLKTDPSARWTFTVGTPPTIAGAGDCL
jgi:prepilin-type N-terminal cleavage/methylation domain-containing protein